MAFFGTHYVTVLTWGEGEATLHVNRCSKLVISGLTFHLIHSNTGNMYCMCLNFSVYDVKDV